MTRTVFVTALAVAPLVLHAQEPVDTARLGPIVVTADRLPIPAAAVPAAVTVLSGAALRAQGIRTVADALRTVPGATVVASGSFGAQTSLFVRGGESDYVKVLIDGVPQNQPGGAYDFAHLTLDGVDRIEVVRGPVSVLYGSDALGRPRRWRPRVRLRTQLFPVRNGRDLSGQQPLPQRGGERPARLAHGPAR